MTWLGDPATWDEVKERHPLGTTITGAVYSVAPFGVFINLGGGGVGLLLVPEMAGENRKQVTDYPQIGQFVTARVIHHRESERQVSLTQRT